MSIRYVYSVVLIIVLCAWFGKSTTKPPKASKPKSIDTKHVISTMVNDPTTIGFEGEDWNAGGNCNIEFINGIQMKNKVHPIVNNSNIKLVGWAMDYENELLPERVAVRFTSKDSSNYYALSNSGLMREDVRKYFKLPARLSASGFALSTNLGSFPEGIYALSLIVQYENASYVCDNGRKIHVR